MSFLPHCIAAALCGLFLWHGAMGAFMLVGISTRPAAVMGIVVAVLAVLHGLWGCVRLVGTLRRPYGFRYAMANRLFWLRRVSGLAIVPLAVLHVGVFGAVQGSYYILYEFTLTAALVQIAFLTVVALHVALNLRPLCIALGLASYEQRRADGYIILAICYLFMVGTIISYYWGWRSL